MNDETTRRGFLGSVAGGALAAGTIPWSGLLSAQTPAVQGTAVDDSWTKKITGTHRIVFDSPGIEDGLALQHASTWTQSMKESFGADATLNAVVVIRHKAAAMVVDDSLWAALELGKENSIKGRGSDDWSVVNPFARQIASAIQRGTVVLACRLALGQVSSDLARQAQISRQEATDRMMAHLVPGVIVQPSGIYAVSRAQEMGCGYLRST